MDLDPTIFVRLCVSIPLLYVGQIMATDPARFLSLCDSLASGLRQFDQHLRGNTWHTRFQEPEPARRSPITLNLVRFAGFVVALAALAYLPLTIGTNRTG